MAIPIIMTHSLIEDLNDGCVIELITQRGDIVEIIHEDFVGAAKVSETSDSGSVDQ